MDLQYIVKYWSPIGYRINVLIEKLQNGIFYPWIAPKSKNDDTDNSDW